MYGSGCCVLGGIVVELAKKNEVVTPVPGFSFNVFQGASQRPRFVLQIERHVVSLAELTDLERADLGRALAISVEAIQESPGVEKVYIESYNETPPGHVHFHLIPRFSSDTGAVGPSLPASAEVPDGFRLNDVMTTVGKQPGLRPAFRRESPLTERVRKALRLWNSKLSAYLLVRKIARGRFAPVGKHFDAGETYVLAWFSLLLVMCALSSALVLPQPLSVLLAIVAAYRWIDLSVYVATILLTTYVSVLQSLARSLLLFTVNVLELLFIGFLWQRAAGAGRGVSLNQTFGVGPEATDPTLLMDICKKATETSLVLVVGLAIAMVVGKIGNTFLEAPGVKR